MDSKKKVGAVHKGRPQGQGGVWSNADKGRVKDLATSARRHFFKSCFSMLCRHSLWVMAIKFGHIYKFGHTSKFGHIHVSEFIRAELHWLPMHRRIAFKILML